MPFSTHFILAHPFGETSNPEEIIAGPFSAERAADALEAHLLNGGYPARVACLGEVVEPISYAWGTRFDGEKRPRPYLTSDSFATATEARRAMHIFARRTKGEATAVYGLVPVKE